MKNTEHFENAKENEKKDLMLLVEINWKQVNTTQGKKGWLLQFMVVLTLKRRLYDDDRANAWGGLIYSIIGAM